jgi:hypothetical protein
MDLSLGQGRKTHQRDHGRVQQLPHRLFHFPSPLRRYSAHGWPIPKWLKNQSFFLGRSNINRAYILVFGAMPDAGPTVCRPIACFARSRPAPVSLRIATAARQPAAKYTVSEIRWRIPNTPLPHGHGSDRSRARKQAVFRYVGKLLKRCTEPATNAVERTLAGVLQLRLPCLASSSSKAPMARPKLCR